MNIEAFQKLLERIDPELSKDEKKDKIIQIADSSHFMECYSTKLILMDGLQYEINLVEQNGKKTGLLFCDMKKLKKDSYHPSQYTPFSSSFFREQTRVEEFWFVFVEEAVNPNIKKFLDFIGKHNLGCHYNKIFLFSFFESTILQLK